MRNPTDFALRQEYERFKDLGDKLVEIGGRLNWESFIPDLEASTGTIPNAAGFNRNPQWKV